MLTVERARRSSSASTARRDFGLRAFASGEEVVQRRKRLRRVLMPMWGLRFGVEVGRTAPPRAGSSACRGPSGGCSRQLRYAVRKARGDSPIGFRFFGNAEA